MKTGVVAGAVATNPATGASIPVFVADDVLPASSEQHRRCRHNLALVLGCFMKWLVWPRLAARAVAVWLHPPTSTSSSLSTSPQSADP